MTTIGYGDVTPKSWQESLITIFVELVGASVFGYMIGNIASVISEMDQFGAQLKARMDGLKNYLTYKKFPRAMQKRVRKTCAHYYGKKTINRPDWDKARRPPAASFSFSGAPPSCAAALRSQSGSSSSRERAIQKTLAARDGCAAREEVATPAGAVCRA